MGRQMTEEDVASISPKPLLLLFFQCLQFSQLRLFWFGFSFFSFPFNTTYGMRIRTRRRDVKSNYWESAMPNTHAHCFVHQLNQQALTLTVLSGSSIIRRIWHDPKKRVLGLHKSTTKFSSTSPNRNKDANVPYHMSRIYRFTSFDSIAMSKWGSNMLLDQREDQGVYLYLDWLDGIGPSQWVKCIDSRNRSKHAIDLWQVFCVRLHRKSTGRSGFRVGFLMQQIKFDVVLSFGVCSL
jgi:hypothetical protein